MRRVISLRGRIAQLRWAEAGETVGYGASEHLQRRSLIATVAVGYADGYQRLLGHHPAKPPALAYIDDEAAPVLGRVSMDAITLDVTDIAGAEDMRGDFAELIGSHVSIDDLADRAETIGYEILTGLGRRFKRVYVGG